MKILQFFYTNFSLPTSTHTRKQQISFKHSIIKGAKASGKRAFVLNYLQKFQSSEILFLDFEDLRFRPQCLHSLGHFLEDKPMINALVFCGVGEDFSFDFSQFKDKEIFLITEFKNLSLQGFKELELDFLDFEEYLSLDKNIQNLNAQMSSYFQSGRRAAFADFNLFLRASFSVLELEILAFIARNLTKEFSINELFKELKTRMKISKDSLYHSVYGLENRFVIRFLNHDEKRLKRVFFADFALKNALSIQKDFKALFYNAIFCELLKFKDELYYNKVFDFYLKKQKIALIPSAFWDKSLLILKAKKLILKALENQIFHLIFITLNDEEVFYEKGVKVELISFSNWALSF